MADNGNVTKKDNGDIEITAGGKTLTISHNGDVLTVNNGNGSSTVDTSAGIGTTSTIGNGATVMELYVDSRIIADKPNTRKNKGVVIFAFDSPGAG
ncbi:MAG: hypothetical protein H6Q54_425 [Deltaproteobacteria bacterium]|jgi:hypothetical protein|nr:hypothetical protein [Deltaproteobacteria bacterium]